MTLEEFTLEVLSEKLIYDADSKSLVIWAVKAMELGYESENLCILAGLDNAPTIERENYFTKALIDLKLKFDQSEKELIEFYSLNIAKKAIANKISLDIAFNQILRIASFTNYNYRYTPFYEIKEDLEALNYSEATIFNVDLTLENYNTFILEEFKIFVEMEELEIPNEERSKCFCTICKKLDKPIMGDNVWCCNFCNSTELLFNNNHKVKRMIIDEYRKRII